MSIAVWNQCCILLQHSWNLLDLNSSRTYNAGEYAQFCEVGPFRQILVQDF